MKKAIGNFMSKIKRPPGMSETVKNYNYEEKSWFTRGYLKALEQKELIIKKLEDKGVKAKKKAVIKYDISRDLTDYCVWREFSKNQNEDSQMILMTNFGRLNVSPSDLVRAWGLPNYRTQHRKYNLGLFYFEDCELGKYIIYDMQEEGSPFVEMKEKQGYYYAFDQFFQSEEKHSFRVQSLKYDDKEKFLHFVKRRINKVRSKEEPTYEELTEQKFGKIQDFNDYDLEFKDEILPIVFTHNRTQLNPLLVNPPDLDFIKDEEFNHKPPMKSKV